MIGPMRVTTRLAFALAIPTFVILSGAVTLAYAQPSPSPSRKRKQFSPVSPRASACAIEASDHTTIDIVNPRLAPIRS